ALEPGAGQLRRGPAAHVDGVRSEASGDPGPGLELQRGEEALLEEHALAQRGHGEVAVGAAPGAEGEGDGERPRDAAAQRERLRKRRRPGKDLVPLLGRHNPCSVPRIPPRCGPRSRGATRGMAGKSFKGNLEILNLSDIFQSLAMNRHSGTLIVN